MRHDVADPNDGDATSRLPQHTPSSRAYSERVAEFAEQGGREWFCEYVHGHFFGRRVDDGDGVRFDSLTSEVILDVDMLRARMVCVVLRKRFRSLVVTKDGCGVSERQHDFTVQTS